VTGIAELAERYRIQTHYVGIDGATRHPPDATLEALLSAFGVPCDDPDARARSAAAAPPGPAPVLRAPDGVRCFLPDWLETGRGWGVAVQLYQIRSGRNWGIGDFQDLADLARLLGAAGADFVGLNPLHALFLADPGYCSPFSPSNRRFLNPLYIAVDRVPGAPAPDAALLQTLRMSDLVDYPGVAQAKLEALRAAWAAGGADTDALARFRAAGGAALARHARFEALSLHMVAEGRGGRGWPSWPDAFHDPDAPAVHAFAAEHGAAVDFQVWLQYLADRQLAAARDAAIAAGMRLGLYLDFAVGEASDGSSTWSDRDAVVPGVRVGAPPDYFNAAGQDWGLAPLSPVGMTAAHAAPFHDVMADATRRAGALRIDHAMALWQLFLIPDGATPAEGTYVRFPVEDMLRALAAASAENRTVIIGEDLGNVPPGFREVMDAAGILSYRILLFERGDRGFIPPEDYPRNALVCLSTHDLPTFRGWWHGDDVALRAEHDLIDAAAAAQQAAARETERAELLADLAAADLFSGTPPGSEVPSELVIAVHRHLARTPSRLFAARLEDMTGTIAPVNLPSTVDAYPNWRTKLPVTVGDLPGTALFDRIAAALAAARPRAPA